MNMDKMPAELADPYPAGRRVAADVLRQAEPDDEDEEDDEEDDEGNDEDQDDGNSDGYSE